MLLPYLFSDMHQMCVQCSLLNCWYLVSYVEHIYMLTLPCIMHVTYVASMMYMLNNDIKIITLILHSAVMLV